MLPRSQEEIINAWIRMVKSDRGSKEHEEVFWSFELVYDMTRERPEEAWSFILATLRADSGPKVMEVLSAGPLEDLLVYHGDHVISRVEAEARQNPQFAELLGGVWKNAMKEDIWQRVQAVWNRAGWDGNPE